VILFTLKS